MKAKDATAILRRHGLIPEKLHQKFVDMAENDIEVEIVGLSAPLPPGDPEDKIFRSELTTGAAIRFRFK